jgi:hypothetical protein
VAKQILDHLDRWEPFAGPEQVFRPEAFNGRSGARGEPDRGTGPGVAHRSADAMQARGVGPALEACRPLAWSRGGTTGAPLTSCLSEACVPCAFVIDARKEWFT